MVSSVLESRALRRPLGAKVIPQGVFYRVWAPKAGVLTVEIQDPSGRTLRSVRLRQMAMGYHEGEDPAGRAGDLYRFKINNGPSFPDPVSRFQPYGVHGPSQVVDPDTFSWRNESRWRRPPFRDFVIYELHVGTFTHTGTFRAAVEKFRYLAELGVTAIEVMPIADFAGSRNWGYDGTCLFAPSRAYGTPDDFRYFVDAAHGHGLAVILDVVYNHFGPDGCYVAAYADAYFDPSISTPWGAAINFGATDAFHVREFYLANIRYWMDEFHLDAFRLDATHAIIDHSDRHILLEIAEEAHSRGRYVIAEDERNEARLLSPKEEKGYQLDAVWADDFHHAVETALIDASNYKKDFEGELHELADALRNGWLYRGRLYDSHGGIRGTECSHLPLTSFVFCISNHDQCGNRAFGERLNQMVPIEIYRAASALLCLCPYTPLLFMGQEWGPSTPFQYFTDHKPELGTAVEAGRLREIRQKPVSLADRALAEIPSPQAASTFAQSTLRWDELDQAPHSGVLALHRELLNRRQQTPAFRPLDRAAVEVADLPFGVIAIRYHDYRGDWLLVCDLEGDHAGRLIDHRIGRLNPGQLWKVQLSTNEQRFGGDGAIAYDQMTGVVTFTVAEAVLLRAQS